MMIKLLLEEAGQYFYCEARKTALHDYEGIVHFLHKVGDGNALVRGKTCHIKPTFDSRSDALTAAEEYGKQVALKHVRLPTGNHVTTCEPCTELSAQKAVRVAAPCLVKSAC